MTRGRKPKPTNLKKLAGNPGKRPLNENEPQPLVPDHTPRVPRYLNEYGKKEWRWLVKVLKDLGLYTVVDRTALAMYCQAYGRWREAEEKVSQEGAVLVSEEGNYYQSPWLHTANRAWDQMKAMLPEFGLTPSARSRLEVAARDKGEDLASILFGGGA
jgi:P27 family predicted phage terminase small subunit